MVDFDAHFLSFGAAKLENFAQIVVGIEKNCTFAASLIQPIKAF
jgi:hypothetical protein